MSKHPGSCSSLSGGLSSLPPQMGWRAGCVHTLGREHHRPHPGGLDGPSPALPLGPLLMHGHGEAWQGDARRPRPRSNEASLPKSKRALPVRGTLVLSALRKENDAPNETGSTTDCRTHLTSNMQDGAKGGG